jgi:hypothetical protein
MLDNALAEGGRVIRQITGKRQLGQLHHAKCVMTPHLVADDNASDGPAERAFR